MTYNVHSCRGGDGRTRPERILNVIRRANPDVVALQELDGPAASHAFASALGMQHFYVEARTKGDTGFGNAVLTRLPGKLVRHDALPRLHTGTETRAAQSVQVEAEFGLVNIVNTHLGLSDAERMLQVERLLDSEWLPQPDQQYCILLGDLNARPGSRAYARLARQLQDAQSSLGRRQSTFPALFPIVRIDHVFTNQLLTPVKTEVPVHATARVASDHRPLVVDLAPITSDPSSPLE